MALPKFDELFNALLRAIRELGGSGTNNEIDDRIAENLKLSQEDINQMQYGSRTKFSYRVAWAKNYLKRYGLLENSSRGVWSLTQKGLDTQRVDKNEVKKIVRMLDANQGKKPLKDEEIAEGDLLKSWETEMLSELKSMQPDAFERLCQRLLRESGFSEVKVTGKTGDGGIDGTGIYKINGLISMRVIFQSKRYKDNVGSPLIREFKGTMVGRAEKGIFITTGSFSRDAKQEAIRDGAAPIDLIDGDELVQLLKNLGLGCQVALEENVIINKEWFRNL